MAENNASGFLKFLSTTSDKLSSIDKKYGQLIFVKDTKQIYFDHQNNNRIPYQQIFFLETEKEKEELGETFFGLYYIKETNTLWNLDNNGWVKINIGSSENPDLQNLQFITSIENTLGEENVLYVDDFDRLWRYKKDQIGWIEVGGPKWETFS